MLPGQESVPENYLDVNIGLAQKDPLAFIDSVLTHHGQKVWYISFNIKDRVWEISQKIKWSKDKDKLIFTKYI